MSKDDHNNTNEPLSGYGEPLSFKQVWEMFQETDREFKDIARRFKETDRKFQETDRKIDKLAKMYGGVSENSRDAAEDFFRRGLERRDSIFGFEYEEVDHLARKSKKLQGEYDIVLHNGEYSIVIEVKYKLHPDDVEDFIHRKLPEFKPLFPEYAGKRLIGALAAMSVPKTSYELAENHGLLVLTQSGEHIAVMNPKGFNFKTF